ncbi:Mediator of RNA polymerase II transcription subunit 14 [Vitis vinifera]|uniref:Mediator of RNA polymerase II transcription subunit 14 n=1 Tax=Vitis vinifera TaxID=29760 RepID=A0A438DRQ1_VITVI|nr:Mediator of RNA polymerase II transcription subunit 14 [Vitis vinifera]RVW95996.1 Mediator of RNA polymerase II transcription subunit 14 [Vitis vinifera]
MAELGHQTVEFSTLVSRAAEESFLSLKDLMEISKSSDQSDSEKKISLLKFIVKTQQRMLRLNVLAKWCQQLDVFGLGSESRLLGECKPMKKLEFSEAA